MSLLPQRNKFPVQPESLADRLSQLGAGGTGHSMSDPIECGGRWWVFCSCGWLFSADDVDDVPSRCDVDRTLFDAAQTLAMVERIAAKSRIELQGLLRRPASAA